MKVDDKVEVVTSQLVPQAQILNQRRSGTIPDDPVDVSVRLKQSGEHVLRQERNASLRIAFSQRSKRRRRAEYVSSRTESDNEDLHGENLQSLPLLMRHASLPDRSSGVCVRTRAAGRSLEEWRENVQIRSRSAVNAR